MSDKVNQTNTFIIKNTNSQNATWQGSVTRGDEQRKKYFRSALEVLKFIDGAIDKCEETEGGCHEC